MEGYVSVTPPEQRCLLGNRLLSVVKSFLSHKLVDVDLLSRSRR